MLLASDPSFGAAVAAVAADCLGASSTAAPAEVAIWLRGMAAAAASSSAGAPAAAAPDAKLLNFGTKVHRIAARARANVSAKTAGGAAAAPQPAVAAVR
jgi:hypothetical protein